MKGPCHIRTYERDEEDLAIETCKLLTKTYGNQWHFRVVDVSDHWQILTGSESIPDDIWYACRSYSNGFADGWRLGGEK